MNFFYQLSPEKKEDRATLMLIFTRQQVQSKIMFRV